MPRNNTANQSKEVMVGNAAMPDGAVTAAKRKFPQMTVMTGFR